MSLTVRNEKIPLDLLIKNKCPNELLSNVGTRMPHYTQFLLSSPPVPSLHHFRTHHLPKRLVPPQCSEVPLQLDLPWSLWTLTSLVGSIAVEPLPSWRKQSRTQEEGLNCNSLTLKTFSKRWTLSIAYWTQKLICSKQ